MKPPLSSIASPPLAPPEAGEVHVWNLALDADDAELLLYRGVLDETESARAARFIRPIHRTRFAVGRGKLRMLLGAYLNIAPEAVCFEYGAQGKPRLTQDCNAVGLAFNLSHSDDAAVLAVSRFATLGIDIEACRESRDLLPIARRFFAPEEQAQLLAMPPSQQPAAFYQGWTCKEALLKAWGTGLTTPLDRFVVDLRSGHAGLRSIDLPDYADTPWHLYTLDAPIGYATALALPAPLRKLELRNWPAAQESDRP